MALLPFGKLWPAKARVSASSSELWCVHKVPKAKLVGRVRWCVTQTSTWKLRLKSACNHNKYESAGNPEAKRNSVLFQGLFCLRRVGGGQADYRIENGERLPNCGEMRLQASSSMAAFKIPASAISHMASHENKPHQDVSRRSFTFMRPGQWQCETTAWKIKPSMQSVRACTRRAERVADRRATLIMSIGVARVSHHQHHDGTNIIASLGHLVPLPS